MSKKSHFSTLYPGSKLCKGGPRIMTAGAFLQSKKEDAAAVKIQASYRSFRSRQKIKRQVKESTAAVPESPGKSSILSNTQTVSSNVSSNANDTEIGNETNNTNDNESPKSQLDCVYKIVVFTGNRWAADCDADLYVILYGIIGSSEKQWLKQDPNVSRFKQNQVV
ncbi:unnamed protein product [Soboliphyme baturini]|uniref:PLAT domain-containing protein n=1 Tax=Soboliphyme baturini TaxID=241478 RepID=A0A183IUM3_9BILA|nr:unnamed protein product [Soboliphyme baturini]